MVASRRVNSRDIAQAGGLKELISQQIEFVRSGPMELKEKGAMFLHNLCNQPRGLDGEQTAENSVLIAQGGAIKPLIVLVGNGSPVAQLHACGALASIASNRQVKASVCEGFQKEIYSSGGVQPIAMALRAGDPSTQEEAAAAMASLSQLNEAQESIIKAGAILPLVAMIKMASDDTQMHASFALANIAEDNPEGQTMIAKTGALPLLINLLGL